MLINNSYTTQMPFKCLRGDPNKIVRIISQVYVIYRILFDHVMFERTQHTHTTN